MGKKMNETAKSLIQRQSVVQNKYPVPSDVQASPLATMTSQAGNKSVLWKIKDSEGERFQITTVYADDTVVRKQFKPSELHRLLLSQTRKPKED